LTFRSFYFFGGAMRWCCGTVVPWCLGTVRQGGDVSQWSEWLMDVAGGPLQHADVDCTGSRVVRLSSPSSSSSAMTVRLPILVKSVAYHVVCPSSMIASECLLGEIDGWRRPGRTTRAHCRLYGRREIGVGKRKREDSVRYARKLKRQL